MGNKGEIKGKSPVPPSPKVSVLGTGAALVLPVHELLLPGLGQAREKPRNAGLAGFSCFYCGDFLCFRGQSMEVLPGTSTGRGWWGNRGGTPREILWGLEGRALKLKGRFRGC